MSTRTYVEDWFSISQKATIEATSQLLKIKLYIAVAVVYELVGNVH